MANCPATLTPGDYEMTQNDCQDDSKVIFAVKLTDSAYRAIEEFQHYSNTNCFTNGERAQIQMNGNSGMLHIPTLDNEDGYNFDFSVDAVEGSLECVQQTDEGLDVLGPIHHRMRIHANDDVYVETRTKIAIAGETERNKRTKVIKPNKDEIGRKVKKPVTTLANQHITHNENHDNMRAKLPTGDVTSRKTSLGRSLNKLANGDTHLGLKQPSQHSSASSSLHDNHLKNSGKSTHGRCSSSDVSSSLPILTPALQPFSTLTNGNVNCNNRASAGHYRSPASSATSTVVKQSGNEMKPSVSKHSTAAKEKPKRGRPPAASKGVKASSAKGNNQPDITRCKIRERVIQMLAVRAYKKLELYNRLQKEGLRDCERSVIGTVLRDVALLRDNAYNLRRHIWNDVKEDWPFYSEQERQQLERNKPQNLTPPVSSDAASLTSGQSPPLLNSPSPPQLVTDSDSNGSNSLKRPSEGSYDPVSSKKRRISHVTTKERVGNHMNLPNTNNLVHIGNAQAVENSKVSNDAQNNAHSVAMQTKGGNTSKQPTQRKRKSKAPITDQQPAESACEEKSRSSKKSTADKLKNSKESKKVGTDAKQDKPKKSEIQRIDSKKDTPKESQEQREATTPSTSKETTRKSKSKKDKEELNSNKNKIDVPVSSRKRTTKPEKTGPTSTNRSLEASKHVEKQSSQYVESKLQNQQQVAAQETAAQHSATRSFESTKYTEQPSSQHAQPQHHPQPQITSQETTEHSANTGANTAEPQGFDFSSYTPITCVEQRRLYKAKFERDFEEYSQLLERVENVRRNFQILTSQLQQVPPGSPSYEHIHQLIMEEYERVHSAEELQRKQRFDYLHAKLAHITNLVNDYDQMLTSLAEAAAREAAAREAAAREAAAMEAAAREAAAIEVAAREAAAIEAAAREAAAREAAAIEAAVLRHRQYQQQQQQNIPMTQMPETEEVNSYAMNASKHMQTTSAQPNNSHVSPIETDSEDEEEEQINGHPEGQAQYENVVQNSTRPLAPSSEAQLLPQQAQHESVQINGHPNEQETDSSSSESDDSSDSSSDDSSDESSSESSSDDSD